MPDEVDEFAAMEAAETQQTNAAQLPPPEEPFEESVVNSLAQTLDSTLQSLSGGELAPMGLEPVQGEQPALPPQLGSTLAGVFGFLSSSDLPEAAPYAEAPVGEMLTTNAGLTDLTILLSEMGADTQLAGAIRRMAPAPAPSAPANDPATAPTPPEAA